METKKLNEAIHAAIFGKNIRQYKEVKDFYKDAISDIDISNLKINIVKEEKEIFEWILDHPDYDFNALFDNYYLKKEMYNYTNEEFYEYFKVYYKTLIFKLEKYNKKDYLIKLSEL